MDDEFEASFERISGNKYAKRKQKNTNKNYFFSRRGAMEQRRAKGKQRGPYKLPTVSPLEAGLNTAGKNELSKTLAEVRDRDIHRKH